MNSVQTGRGVGDYIPPDEILECVTSLLGSTASGFEVPFGGVRNIDYGSDGDSDEGGSGVGVAEINIEYLDLTAPMSISGHSSQVVSVPSEVVVQRDMPSIETPKKFTFNTPKIGKLKRQMDPYPSKVAKDTAIAEYFNFKKRCIQEKIEFYMLNNEKLKLGNEKLRLEIENMNSKL